MKPRYSNGNSLLEQLSKLKSRLYVLLGIMLFIFSNTAMSATTLSSGDIVFVGMNLDGGDEFSFVLLKDVDATTQIRFSDCGVNDPGTISCVAAGDGESVWTSGIAVSAGTVVTISALSTVNNSRVTAGPGSMAVSPSPLHQSAMSSIGDQILAYQGTLAAPVFLAGINSNESATDANWSGSTTGNQNSAAPDALLASGINAAFRLHSGGTEVDNWQFNCTGGTVSGTAQQIRDTIHVIGSWSSNNSTAYSPAAKACTYTVVTNVARTFDWETGVDNGATVTQTVSGVTATFTTSNSDAELTNGAGFAGSTANVVFTSAANASSSATITFSSAINISSVFAFDADASGGSTWTFTPTGGSNSAVVQAVGAATGSTVALNWSDVTSFTVTSSQGNETFGLDNVVSTFNSAPIATAPSAPTVNQNDTNVALADTIQIADSDAGDTQTVTFTITGGTLTTGAIGITFGGGGNGSASFTAQGSLTNINTALNAAIFTPTNGLSGVNAGTIAFVTNDGTVNSNNALVSFNITAVNQEPSFTKGANEFVLEDAGFQTVNGWATSLNKGAASESGQTLSFALTNDNNGLFSSQPAINASGNLTYTPTANVSGSTTVSVVLTDDGGTANGGDDTFATQTFTITVTGVNDEPSFTKGANEFVLDNAGAQTVNGWATALNKGAADESGQTLSFTVLNDNNALFSAQPAVNSSGNLSYTPAVGQSGVANLSVTLKDDGGGANGGDDTFAVQQFTISVSVAAPTITSAIYNASTGAFVVTGTNFAGNAGGSDVDVSDLTFTGEDGSSYTLTDSADVEITSATEFTVSLSATDKLAINGLLNKDGTAAVSGTTYNLAAADDFITNVTSGNTADANNAITVSSVAASTLTSATYNASTGVFVVTGSNFISKAGATNDVVLSNLTLFGSMAGSRTLTTSNVEVSTATQFTVTLNAADKTAVNALLDKNGSTSSDGISGYYFSAANHWLAAAAAASNIADPVTLITVSGVADSDGSLTSAAAVTEPVGLGTTVTTAGAAVDLFDFTLTDGGAADGQAMTVSQVVVNVSGTSTDTERGQITWRLNGNDVSNVTGTYSAAADTVTFSSLSISIANNTSEVYTVNAYYNNNTGLTEGLTYILSVDGDTDLTVGGSGTQMGSTSAINNGTGSRVDVVATALAFTTQPAGSVSGSSLTTQPVVTARDAFGNTDSDFTETVTLTEASAGSLSGDSVAAVSGVATFTSVNYSASADQESFTLTADDDNGSGLNFPTVNASSVTSDVVATKLVFDTQPAPLSVNSGEATAMTTVPVVSAKDANNVLDTGYTTSITLAEVNGAGSATMTGNNDSDGDGATVTLMPISGVATFTGLNVNYTAAGSASENFNLRASSGGLSTANSSQFLANTDTTNPRVSSIVRQTPTSSPTNTDSLIWRVTFDENVSNVNAGDFSVSGSTATVTNVSTVTASTVFDVTISGGDLADLNATATLGFAGGQNITDSAGNALTNTAPTGTNNNSYVVDNNAPTVTIGASSASDTSGGPVTYTLTYTNADTITLASGNITLNKTGSANGSVAVSGTGNTRTVTISSITGDGTLGITVAANTASDDAGNNAAAPSASATFNVDNSVPTVIVGAPSASDTNSGPVTYTLTYSGADTITLANGNITLNKTGTANGTVVVSGSGNTRTVTITSITGDGTLGISVAANTASDTAGNNSAAPASSATFNVDNSAPTVTVGAPSASDTNNGPITYTLTYSNADNIAVTSGDITLNKTGDANGSVAVSGSGNTRTVTISAISGDGTLGISVTANTASDTAGNNADAPAASATFNVDNSAPTLSISAPSVTDINSGSVTYRLTYTNADSITLANGNITLNKTGSANGSVAVSGTGNARTVTISSITGDGTLGISVAANTASDDAGNNSAAPSASATFNVDNSAPTVSVGAPSVSDTNAGPVTFTLTYSGANNISLANGNITLIKTGTANGSVAVSGSGSTSRTVTISGITGDGTLGISVAANTASDTAGNNALASGASSTFNVDNSVPVVVIGAPSVTDTNAGPVTYALTYTGADTISLAGGNVTLNKTGTANGTVAVSGTGNNRIVTISAITGDGTLGISVAASTASDDAGNNAVAPAASATFAVDNNAPTLEIGAPSVTTTRVGPVTFDLTYVDADSISLALGDISLVKTGDANGTLALSGTGNNRTVTISAISGDGTLGISVAANTASDNAGNNALLANSASTVAIVSNQSGTLNISGNTVVGETLTASLADADGLTGITITYQWTSGGTNVGSNSDSYTLLASDVGKSITVNAQYTDQRGTAENINSTATDAIITIQSDAVNRISSTANQAGGTEPTVDDYKTAGISDVSDVVLTRILPLINSAVARQSDSTDVDDVSELQALVNVILEGQDNDSDGLPNLVEGTGDTDKDGTTDREDTDSDNDGVADQLEVRLTLTDSDSDGIIDVLDADVGNDGQVDTDKVDANFDGVDDALDSMAELIAKSRVNTQAAPVVGGEVELPFNQFDQDKDQRPNHLDLDADNDGIMDVVESGLNDTNGDGKLDNGDTVITDGSQLSDTDADALPNMLDVKSDGISFDLSVNGLPDTLDTDANGILDSTIDMDRDGIIDSVDNAVGAQGTLPDMDKDGIPNHADEDDDGDGIPDVDENPQQKHFTGQDADADGIDDGVDQNINGVLEGTDADNNGVRDDRELADLDGDGFADYLDADSDNDGILDGQDIVVNVGPDVKKGGVGIMGVMMLLLLSGLRYSRTVLRMSAVLLLSLSAAISHAENWQLNLGLGQSSLQPDLASSLGTSDGRDWAVQLGLGYRVYSDWLIELRYSDLGDAQIRSNQGRSTLGYQTLALDTKYQLPLLQGTGWTPYVLGGIAVNRMQADDLSLEKKTDSGLMLGTGISYRFKEFQLNTELIRYNDDLAGWFMGVQKDF